MLNDSYSFDDDNESVVLQSVGAAVFGVILYIFGLPANILLIVTCTRLKRLRVRHNVFTVNLAVYDTLIIGILLPITFVTSATGNYPLSPDACLFAAILSHTCFTGSVSTLMFISFDRYIKICKSKCYNRIFNKKSICLSCICIWLIGFIFTIPLVILEDGFVLDLTLQICIFNRYKYRAYSVVYMFLCLMVPISLTVLCYQRIYRYLVKSKRRLYRNWNNGLAQARLKHENAICRAHFAVFTAYFILLMPFGIVAMLEDEDDVPDTVHLIVMYLCYTNSCVNTFVYGVLNSNIRKAYKELFTCLGSRRNENSSSGIPGRSQTVSLTNKIYPVTGNTLPDSEGRYYI
ncbi:melatonin-related receptor-like [Argopecten irradians]|uniref:melatonin-related receptor-like n=1 Tax=Argopecten irradians TaxID=31199 RepID=UPI00371F500E